MMTERRPISLYLHIPFCVKKCFYCDFLSAPAGEEEKERYVRALVKEMELEAWKYSGYEVETVFLGGGTPSLVPVKLLEQILGAVRGNYSVAEDAEITMEVNPGTVDGEKLAAYRRMGINRLSIGLQSAVDDELKRLGRIHTAADFFQTYEYTVKTGFNNINVDLMSAIPAQTPESYQETLKKVLALRPQPSHISAYSLIIEEGTPFYENPPALPDEETDRLLYKITNDILKESGYHRYEISNYAKEGFACRHNQVYWKRGDYAGFGIGAASLVENVRFSNCRDRQKYESCLEQGLTEAIKEDIKRLSVEEQMEEFMFLGLRLTEGICCGDFYKTFGKTVEEVYPGLIRRLEEQGLLISEKDEKGERKRIFLSEFGLDVSNVVMAEFLLT